MAGRAGPPSPVAFADGTNHRPHRRPPATAAVTSGRRCARTEKPPRCCESTVRRTMLAMRGGAREGRSGGCFTRPLRFRSHRDIRLSMPGKSMDNGSRVIGCHPVVSVR
ncbi:hypothetical protein CUT44_16775 [Streptomyces carminius]|uniref:Uncharacterized protein n=1 Tax=Streptomyces carminius TaxID=2665496 RepID=A0A2M8LXL9_9ACTN|nr:hypothetical protein CUT44_16775 [Streptomyces carminius]